MTAFIVNRLDLRGVRVGLNRIEWDEFPFTDSLIGKAAVVFRTNHNDDGSVDGEVRVSDPAVRSIEVFDDNGNDVTPLEDEQAMRELRQVVLDQFERERDCLVESFWCLN
jgi:hypothetical protein